MSNNGQSSQSDASYLKTITVIIGFITAIILLIVALIQLGVIPINNSASASTSIAGQYNGSVDNTLINKRVCMSLLINQSQDKRSINGVVTICSGLLGSGHFTGTINAGTIQFKDQSDQVIEPILFSGKVQSDGSLSGTYCSVNEQDQCDPNAGNGIWNVSKS